MKSLVRESTYANRLQWGRRVNTAECESRKAGDIAALLASMGPPREHGGMPSSRTAMHSWSYGEGCERVGFVMQKGRFFGPDSVFWVCLKT